ncbi:phosphate system positive regulatory protein Pho81p [Trichomonascus vanleenenianus]|uniref:Pho81p n=1 Tax=Trichomonascus vanleenenianus TaxID=2268995 RepID=UPI003ECB3BD3
MKFGKTLDKRRLDLPEYGDYFIDYKGLKKLIKRLSAPDPAALATVSQAEIQRSLQANKATFFFQLERELEKVNNFYLQKEQELNVRLNILLEKKQNAFRDGALESKSSVTYISLHEGFLRFRRDLDRLEQFIELSQTGFSKALKKWDKRSKSHTKEMFLTRAVDIQPVFHREELARLSDSASQSIMELEAWSDGDAMIFESGNKGKKGTSSGGVNSIRDRDDLYHEFKRMVESQHIAHEDAKIRETVNEWVEQLRATPNAAERITRIFLLIISSSAPDEALLALYDSGMVNLDAEDEISGKNCLHRAAGIGRLKIMEIALKNNVDVNKSDNSGKTPVHYASISDHGEAIRMLAKYGANIDAHDKDNYSPLLYAIVSGFVDCVKTLIELGASVSIDSQKDFIPLNLACQHGNKDIVELILGQMPLICADAEGLFPIHVVARAGHHELVALLKPFVNIDQLDKLNGWTALCYACSEGHVDTVQALIDCNADVKTLDEDGYSALYHAAWEGHIRSVGALSKVLQPDGKGLPVDHSTAYAKLAPTESEKKPLRSPPLSSSSSNTGMELTESFTGMDISELDDIPDLSLPPPIIPLRRYGHNFLDKKIVVQIFFDINKQPITLHTTEGTSAGRLTISSRSTSSIIPRSIILPVTNDDMAFSFQIDSLDNFAMDFEIFPTFGTQIIAKTSALPYVFNTPSSTESFISEHQCQLPLFDMRLKPVGEIAFRFQIVRPFVGKPLEITKYDTYWKSTSQVDKNIVASKQQSVQSLSFVTASSLSGTYARIFVCLTGDRVPVVTAQKWLLDVGEGVKMPIGNLPLETVLKISSNNNRPIEEVYDDLEHVTQPSEVRMALDNFDAVVPLEEFLRHLPVSIRLDVGVLYPTASDASYSNLGQRSFIELNRYADTILNVLFNHAREIRHQSEPQQGDATVNRSIIFSSKHPDVCTVLNWKQPNYPVFFHMNAIRLDANLFEYSSAHSFPVKESDTRCLSIKDASNFAASNNLLGIMCSSRLLAMVPSIVEAVRLMGLVLVASLDDEEEEVNVPGVDGSRTRSVLHFRESIDV